MTPAQKQQMVGLFITSLVLLLVIWLRFFL